MRRKYIFLKKKPKPNTAKIAKKLGVEMKVRKHLIRSWRKKPYMYFCKNQIQKIIVYEETC